MRKLLRFFRDLVIVILLSPVLAFVSMIVVFWFIKLFSTSPPVPQVRYAEFPFKLEYELNGKHLTIEDTLMVRFRGVTMRTENEGPYPKWEENLKKSLWYVFWP